MPGLSALIVLSATACNDATSVATEGPSLRAVNGATYPVVHAGDTVLLEGSGFGSAQGQGAVRFSVQAGSAVATVTSWSDDQVLAVVPDSAASGSVSLVTDSGRTVGVLSTLVRSPAVGLGDFKWNAGPSLPAGLRAAQLVAFTYPLTGGGFAARMQVTGGIRDDTIRPTSLLSTISDSASPGAWSPAVDTAPADLAYSATAGATQALARLRRHDNQDSTVEGVSYLIGGLDGAGRVVSDVRGLSVWENGDQGAWTRLTGLPGPRAGASAAVNYGNLYVIGGFGPDSLATADVLVAVIDSFGAPAGWIDGPPLPEGRAFAGLVIRNHTIYVIGGEAGHVPLGAVAPDTNELRSTVFAARLSPRTGFFQDAGWQTLGTALTAPRSRHVTADLDAGILVATGITTPGAAESEFAAFLPDGSLAPFAPLTAPTIASLAGSPISEAGAAVYLDHGGIPHVVITGGLMAAGGQSTGVWWH